jgi:hypothetical protein
LVRSENSDVKAIYIDGKLKFSGDNISVSKLLSALDVSFNIYTFSDDRAFELEDMPETEEELVALIEDDQDCKIDW